MIQKLTYDTVRKTVDPEILKDIVIAKDGLQEPIIGQERAMEALRFGIGVRAEGFNVFVSGEQGTGKLTAVKAFVEQPATQQPVPDDWCYVNNFKDLYQPRKLNLPAGRATEFRDDMKNLIRDARPALLKAFEHEDFISRKAKILDPLEETQEALFNAVNERARAEGILIQGTPVDIVTVPIVGGKPMTDKDFSRLSEPEKKLVREKQQKFIDALKVAAKQARKLEKEAREKLVKLENETATFAIGALIEEVEDKYASYPEVLHHLREVREDILSNLDSFLGIEKSPARFSPDGNGDQNLFQKRYDVNILVDNKELRGAPVIFEGNPTYNNLFGRVEKESHMGTWLTDLSLIRRGSIHAANGGYLIIRVEELFKNLFSWESLKRAMKNREIIIEEAGDQWGFITTKTLKPQAIPLDVKVILVGERWIYHLLYNFDADFRELFKVKADFDSAMPRTEKNTKDYARFCATLARKENLLPLNSQAIATLIEYGSRISEDQEKLSTRFRDVADVIREAHYYCAIDHSDEIDSGHIRKAIEQKLYRSNLLQQRINEMIENKQILIDINGEKIGQVNGLSVIRLGDIEFGVPSRITCSTGIGKSGVIAIEREARLSGPIHTKGVMILTGYLTEKFVQDKPLSLTARIVFEQSYSPVEGDSASSTELYCVLSALAGLPVRQGIAVTGSVNQKGQIQAIGGVNEKIEGYYEVCKRLGSDGSQGIIIPSANIRNLMLKEEIREAVKVGTFRLWAIDTIEEGIEILTGIAFGSVLEPGTVAALASHRLDDYAEKMKTFLKDEDVQHYH